MSTKCPMCGLVNFAGIETCRRCGTSFGAANAAWSAGAAPQPHSWQQPSSSTWEPPAPPPAAPSSWPPPAAPPPAASSSWQSPSSAPAHDPYSAQGGTMYDGGWPPTPAAPSPYGHGTVYGTPLAGYASYSVTPELADRGMRLVAVIVDNLILFAVFLLPLLFMIGGSQSGAMIGLLLMGVGAIALFAIQLSMLSSSGQTIGKRVAKVRVVKVDTGENGGFVTNVVLRGGVPFLCGMIPYVGPIFSLVNILFIFREDTRCIHDHVAGTVVVKA